jgi:hypothetical protein
MAMAMAMAMSIAMAMVMVAKNLHIAHKSLMQRLLSS